MVTVEKLTADRDDLRLGLDGLRQQQAQLARTIAAQEGALWYVEKLIAQAGADAPGEPDAGEASGEGEAKPVAAAEG